MASTQDVFRRVAQRRTLEWPAYDSTPFYDREPLGGLEQNVRTVAGVWFGHDAHRSVDGFVCHLPWPTSDSLHTTGIQDRHATK
jgi:hypothetical protein